MNGMPDREMTITHLQIIHTWAEFARERDLQFFTEKHLEDIAQWADEAIALLKEQEAVNPLQQNSGGWIRTIALWYCGACHAKISRRTSKYCPNCGRKVKWNGQEAEGERDRLADGDRE